MTLVHTHHTFIAMALDKYTLDRDATDTCYPKWLAILREGEREHPQHCTEEKAYDGHVPPAHF